MLAIYVDKNMSLSGLPGRSDLRTSNSYLKCGQREGGGEYVKVASELASRFHLKRRSINLAVRTGRPGSTTYTG